jgi:hypothetical protein
MNDVTQILQQIEQGDSTAAEQFLPLVDEELRMLAKSRMPSERIDHTWQATALPRRGNSWAGAALPPIAKGTSLAI